MKRITLGQSDLSVSRLCLGTMHFGSRDDAASSQTILDRFVEAGGNFLDTANIYARWIDGCSGGESEELIGRWMQERGNRDDLVIATKVGFEYPGVERGLTAELIVEECDKSLKRLGIDRIDLYYAHKDDRNTPVDETLEAFDRLVDTGKVRYIGASNFTAWRLQKSLDIGERDRRPAYIGIQQRYSYLRPRAGTSFEPQLAASEELLDFCAGESFPLLPYSPLLGGAYAREDKSFPAQYEGPDSDARLKALREVAGELGATANQIVIAWMLHHTFPVVPVVAASSVQQIDEIIAAEQLSLTDEQKRRLDAAGV